MTTGARWTAGGGAGGVAAAGAGDDGEVAGPRRRWRRQKEGQV